MTHGRESWYDEEAGPLVRPYTLTRGRTRSDRYELNLITMVVKAKDGVAGMIPEYLGILRWAEEPVSVAEIAGQLDLPVAVLKVLASDLIDEGYLLFHTPPTKSPTTPSDIDTLQAVLDGIRNI